MNLNLPLIWGYFVALVLTSTGLRHHPEMQPGKAIFHTRAGIHSPLLFTVMAKSECPLFQTRRLQKTHM